MLPDPARDRPVHRRPRDGRTGGPRDMVCLNGLLDPHWYLAEGFWESVGSITPILGGLTASFLMFFVFAYTEGKRGVTREVGYQNSSSRHRPPTVRILPRAGSQPAEGDRRLFQLHGRNHGGRSQRKLAASRRHGRPDGGCQLALAHTESSGKRIRRCPSLAACECGGGTFSLPPTTHRTVPFATGTAGIALAIFASYLWTWRSFHPSPMPSRCAGICSVTS